MKLKVGNQNNHLKLNISAQYSRKIQQCDIYCNIEVFFSIQPLFVYFVCIFVCVAHLCDWCGYIALSYTCAYERGKPRISMLTFHVVWDRVSVIFFSVHVRIAGLWAMKILLLLLPISCKTTRLQALNRAFIWSWVFRFRFSNVFTGICTFTHSVTSPIPL